MPQHPWQDLLNNTFVQDGVMHLLLSYTLMSSPGDLRSRREEMDVDHPSEQP